MTDYTGKFITIDGTDGSGKATQTKMLVDKLKYAGFDVEMADFPQYGKKSAGLVEEYLNGKFGLANEVEPYRGSIFYAVDRYAASFNIRHWLLEGKIVISNRYVTANMGHQGGKIKDFEERKKYFQWLYKLEYEIFNIPKPDLNIILHVDARVAQKLVDNKDHREYIGRKKRDIHETDINHLRDAERTYLEIADIFPGFSLIKCTRDNKIKSRNEIHLMLWNKIMHALNGHKNYPIDFHYKHYKNINKHILSPVETEPKKLFVSTEEDKQESGKINQSNRNDQNLEKSTLRVELLSSVAKLPERAYAHDVGYDLFSVDYYSIMPGERALVKTGIKLAIPRGIAGFIWDKSGVAKDGVHVLGGVVDPGYRGEIIVNLINLGHEIYNISPGQKCAQIILQKIETPVIIETKVDDKTERSAGGHGSSGLF